MVMLKMYLSGHGHLSDTSDPSSPATLGNKSLRQKQSLFFCDFGDSSNPGNSSDSIGSSDFSHF